MKVWGNDAEDSDAEKLAARLQVPLIIQVKQFDTPVPSPTML